MENQNVLCELSGKKMRAERHGNTIFMFCPKFFPVSQAARLFSDVKDPSSLRFDATSPPPSKRFRHRESVGGHDGGQARVFARLPAQFDFSTLVWEMQVFILEFCRRGGFPDLTNPDPTVERKNRPGLPRPTFLRNAFGHGVSA
jgi:hypothetical protein